MKAAVRDVVEPSGSSRQQRPAPSLKGYVYHPLATVFNDLHRRYVVLGTREDYGHVIDVAEYSVLRLAVYHSIYCLSRFCVLDVGSGRE